VIKDTEIIDQVAILEVNQIISDPVEIIQKEMNSQIGNPRVHGLPRYMLQALSIKNGTWANLTNGAMANALLTSGPGGSNVQLIQIKYGPNPQKIIEVEVTPPRRTASSPS
jgi:hypothetical protein